MLEREPAAGGTGSTSRPWVTRGVLGIVLATFFSDFGHEMATAILPQYSLVRLAARGLGEDGARALIRRPTVRSAR